MPEIQPEGQAKAEGTHGDACLQNILTKDHFPFYLPQVPCARRKRSIHLSRGSV